MENQTIYVNKSFKASVSQLYNAWIDQDSLTQWWKPAGRTLQTLDADVKSGGKIKYDLAGIVMQKQN